jgi:predicted unusual protein kinase regulating ubiquinone biosynthesis (AarF/ABC1/UbiB family)
MDEKSINNIPLDQRRYRKVLGFFAGVTLNIIWWEVVLRRILGKRGVARNRNERFRRYARDFRKLAVNMGGVMIKLGQFIGARMDVMPPEIIKELSSNLTQRYRMRLHLVRYTVRHSPTAIGLPSRCSGPA